MKDSEIDNKREREGERERGRESERDPYFWENLTSKRLPPNTILVVIEITFWNYFWFK